MVNSFPLKPFSKYLFEETIVGVIKDSTVGSVTEVLIIKKGRRGGIKMKSIMSSLFKYIKRNW